MPQTQSQTKYSQKKIRSKFLKLLVLIFVAGLWIFALYFLNNFFLIKKIVVLGKTDVKNLNGLDNYKNKNLIFLSDSKAAQNIFRENASLKKVNVRKKFPNELIVEVEEYPGVVNFKNSQGYFILSEDGRLIAKSREPESSLPVAKYYQELNYHQYVAGDRITNEDILATLFFLTKARKLGLSVVSIDINNFDMIVFNLDKSRIYFTTEKSRDTAAYELETIVYRYKIAGKNFAELDLRFDKPVVRF